MWQKLWLLEYVKKSNCLILGFLKGNNHDLWTSVSLALNGDVCIIQRSVIMFVEWIKGSSMARKMLIMHINEAWTHSFAFLMIENNKYLSKIFP